MADANDHWQALFDHTYLRWFDLNNQPALVEILDVMPLVELTLPGGRKSRKPVLVIKQIKGKIARDKPLVLNATNGSAIADIHGVKPSGWKGKRIVLFQDVTQVKGQGDAPCIRIRAAKES